MEKKPTFSWPEIGAGLAILVIIFTLATKNETPDTPLVDKNNKYVQAVAKGGDWFLNNQDDNFIHYEYSIQTRENSRSHHSLREMGALWSITQLANFLDSEDHRKLATKGFAFFEESFIEDKDDKFLYVNISPSKIKLGYNAFAILTLLELDHPDKNSLLEGLAKGILHHQKDDGSLQTFFFSDRATGVDYYPGEALLALMSLYEETGNKDYLEATKKAFPFYVDYWNGNKNTAFIPWQSRANYKLFHATGDEEIAEFIFKMNDYMLSEHNPKNTCSEFRFARGVTTSVFLEGAIQAYKAADDLNDEEHKKCYANFVKEGISFILTLQILDEDKYELPAIGGFLGSASSTTMRVDRNQHSTMAIMDAYNEGLLN